MVIGSSPSIPRPKADTRYSSTRLAWSTHGWRTLFHNVRGGAPTGPPVPVGVLRRWQAACHRHRPGPRGGAAHAEDFRGQAPNTPAAANRRNTSSSPNGQCDELGNGCSRHPSAASEVLAMAMHEPYPGRQWRSVTFDDAKRRVIATDQDAEVDTLNMKCTVGTLPTLRPSRTDCC
ncbi:uncharacterized protein LOC144113398 [Amblyomma americanum]